MMKRLLSFFALLLMLVTSAWADGDMKTVPLTLEAKTAGTIVVSNPQSGMQYSLNGGAKAAVPAEITVAVGDKVAFFGNGTSITSYFSDDSDASNDTKIAGGTAECYIYGNIMSLVDETGFASATTLTGAYAFRSLFNGNANLYNHASKDLVLPATTLADYCYYYMFYNCTNLTAAPELPATTLAESCYRSMFQGCEGLTTAPALPATTLAPDCYRAIFKNCNLTTAPTLPATTLAPRCYQDMFNGCSSLTSVPSLPATTLAEECYYAMFSYCTGLTTVPADFLPVTTLEVGCYRSMFMHCTGLTTVPANLLPATELAESCYMNMFYDTSLTSAPALPATTLAASCYYRMFYTCSNLTAAPVLPATTLVESCYYQMFYNTRYLNAVTCLATDISATSATTGWLKGVAGTGTFVKAEGMEDWSSGTTGIPSSWTVYDNIPLTLEAKTAGTIVVSNPQSGMKYSKNGSSKTAVTSDAITVAIGDKVQFYGNGTSITSYYGTSITGGTAECYIYGYIMSLVDETGFANATTLTADNAFRNLFKDNTNLYNHDTKELLLQAKMLTAGCYQGMFSGCTNLTEAPELPATTLANACYQGMFQGCTGLTTAPALLATTLAQNCYYEMFSGCNSLNAVTCYATDISATDATTDWLSGVAASGTFTKAEETAWTIDSPSGIPVGWTPTDDPLCTPLTLEAISAGTIVVSNPQSGMKYSKNGGAKTAVTSDAITVAIGDKVAFYGNGTSITSYYSDDSDDSNDTRITGGTAECYIYGNIMSLVDENGFATANTLTANNAFRLLFYGNTLLSNHATNKLVLPATTLTEGCYRAMFRGCTSLTSAPALPATALQSYCYYYMFADCTGLTTVPASLPANRLEAYCYALMFNNCTNLTTVPIDFLPATTLGSAACYRSMFNGCTNLTSAPALPATTLTTYCYYQMFKDCSKLTTAPELPATTLVGNCYYEMFNGCSKLNSVTCLATDISASSSRTNWLKGVAKTGTFNKPSSTNWGTRGASKIPSGWTMVNNDPVTLTDGNDLSSLTPCAGGVCEVNYTREFTADKPSTVCLPFDYEVKTGEKFYTFGGVEKDGEGNFVATMNAYAGTNLVANTPYLYVPASTGATDFSGTYTLPAAIEASTTTSGDWKFVGTYTTKTWETAPTGIYGFSAQNTESGISKGEFVKVGAYVRVKPMRSYLMYKEGDEDYHNASARSFGNTTDSESLPERIKVRFVDADGTVTGIGTLNTQTGEVSFDSEAWYTLDGIRLSAKPTKKGIYVNNGKKVMVK